MRIFFRWLAPHVIALSIAMFIAWVVCTVMVWAMDPNENNPTLVHEVEVQGQWLRELSHRIY